MKSLFTVPQKIKVGFQNREGTYTGRLAFVVRDDPKAKNRSWEGWRDCGIDPQHFDNLPLEGFVLNRSVGGARNSYSWNPRNEAIRVYDPRGFEFEISVPNLLLILANTDCSRGKGLEGKFVYGWDKNRLVLLPEESVEYRESIRYTDNKTQTVPKKQIHPGLVYETKQLERITYLGELPFFFDSQYYSRIMKGRQSGETFHIFYDQNGKFLPYKDLKHLARVVSSDVVADYADLLDRYRLSPNGSKTVRFEIRNERFVPCDPKTTYSSISFYREFPKRTEGEAFPEGFVSLDFSRSWDFNTSRYSVKFTHVSTTYQFGIDPDRGLFRSSFSLRENTIHHISHLDPRYVAFQKKMWDFLGGPDILHPPDDPTQIRTNELWMITEAGSEFQVPSNYWTWDFHPR